MERNKRAFIRDKIIYSGDYAIDIGTGSVKHNQFERFYFRPHVDFGNILCIDACEKNIRQRAVKYENKPHIKHLCANVVGIDFKIEPDLITAFHVVEHLSLTELSELLRKLTSITKQQILIETPDQFEDGIGTAMHEGNEFQKHKSLVDEKYLMNYGFKKVYQYTQQSSTFSNSGYLWTP